MQLTRVLGMVAACVAVIGCEREPQPRNLGWVKVTVDTAYKDKPVHFVTYAECIGTYVPGGSFGATPGVRAITMSPKSAGQTLPDGSFMALSLPELCDEFFGLTPISGPWQRKPTPFVPLLVWSDKRLRAMRSEAYVAEEGYARASSKFAPPTAMLEPLLSVPEATANATRHLPRDVMLGSGRLIKTGSGEISNEIGDAPHSLKLWARIAWRLTPIPEPAAFWDVGNRKSDCLDALRYGQLLAPTRAPAGSRTQIDDACRKPLADVIPFVWDGRRFIGHPERSGIVSFQRVSMATKDAPHIVHGKQLKTSDSRDLAQGYWFSEVWSPRMDSTAGE